MIDGDYRDAGRLPASGRSRSSAQTWAVIGSIAGVAGVLVALGAWWLPQQPGSGNDGGNGGNGGGGTSSASSSPTVAAAHRSYVAKVNGLCHTAGVGFQKAGVPSGKDVSGSIAWMRTTNPLLVDLYDNWVGIPRPDGDEAKVRPVLDNFKKLNSHLDWILLQLGNEKNASTQAQYDEYRRQENVEWSAVHDLVPTIQDGFDGIDQGGLDDCKNLIAF